MPDLRPDAVGREVDWTALIDDVCGGHWINPDTGRPAEIPFKTVVIAETLAGRQADLVRRTLPAASYAVVADQATYDVYGAAVLQALGSTARAVVLDHPHADAAQVRRLQAQTRDVEALIAVGSGTINDLCKYATALDGRDFAVFATAPSMNGYTTTTASITLDSGLKTTQPAHAAKGVFIDLAINAAAPQYLIAAGIGDSLCRATAQVDWYLSHRLLGTAYAEAPYALQVADEHALLTHSAGLGRRETSAIGHLHRLMALCGFGISVAGMTHPGSMGEHQISHWIDSFAGPRHPGTLHGQQVGVTSVTMAKLQERILSSGETPVLRPVAVDEAALRRRYPPAAVEACIAACRKKALDSGQCKALNSALERIWPSLRIELGRMAMPASEIAFHIHAAGGPATPGELGIDRDLYRDAVRYAPEMRDRYSMLDLAAGMGILEDFIAEAC